jgi:hypothetical protein
VATPVAGFDPGFWCSDWNQFSILNSGTGPDFDPLAWHKAKVTVKMGVRLPNGSTETDTVFTSILVDVGVRDNGLAELVCIDALARLKRNTIKSTLLYRDPDETPDSGDETGRVYKNFPPAYVVMELLQEAGFTSFMNTSTFEDAIFQEATAGFLQDRLELTRGPWWDVISSQLELANAGLRWNAAGQLEYFNFRPDQAVNAVVYEFEEGRNLLGLNVRRPDTAVVNSVTVTRNDESGGTVETAASPIQDSASISTHDQRDQDVVTSFLEDFPADQVGSERMFFQSEPFPVLEVRGAWDSFRVELGDVVQVDAFKRVGLRSQIGTVFAKAINPAGWVDFLVMDTILTTGGPYLFTDNSQDLNDGQKVW